LIPLFSSSCNSSSKQTKSFDDANAMIISTTKNTESSFNDFVEFLKENDFDIKEKKVTGLEKPIIETYPTVIIDDYPYLEVKVFAVFEKYKIKVWAEYDNSAPNDHSASWVRLRDRKVFYTNWLQFKFLISKYPHQEIK